MLLEKYYPFNTQMFFIQGSAVAMVEYFVKWLTSIERNGNKIIMESYIEPLNQSIPRLPPFTSGDERRFLFVQLDSNWVFYLSNFKLGTDNSVSAVMVDVFKTKCLSICNRQDGKFIDILGWSEQSNSSELLREVGYSIESGLSFFNQGTPFEFERTDLFQKRKIRERFTDESILAFLNGLNIPLNFADDTICRYAFFVHKKGKLWPASKEYSWEEAKKWGL